MFVKNLVQAYSVMTYEDLKFLYVMRSSSLQCSLFFNVEKLCIVTILVLFFVKGIHIFDISHLGAKEVIQGMCWGNNPLYTWRVCWFTRNIL